MLQSTIVTERNFQATFGITVIIKSFAVTGGGDVGENRV